MKVYFKKEPIIRFLIRNNESQTWLARRLEISRSYLSQLIQMQRQPSPKIRKKLMGVFSTEKFDDLFTICEGKQK